MTTHTNPKMAVPPIANTAFTPIFFPFTFDFADPIQKPAAIAANDLILIGTIPAGHVMLYQLSRFAIPQLDSAGSPTGDYSIGTEAVPAALKGSAASETAVALFGEDILIPAAVIGSPTDDTPIYIKAIAASATVPSTGKIVAELAYRAWDSSIDG